MSKSSLIRLVFLPIFLACPLWGQTSPEEAPAPVPTQIARAKKVFVSNCGEESNFRAVHDHWYSGGPNRTYNQFYAAMKEWGRYELVSAPDEADLVFEIGFNDRSEALMNMWQIKLVIVDLKTRIPLWTLTKYPEPAGMTKNRERNYDLAMAGLMDDLKSLVAAPSIRSDPQK